MAYLSPSTLDQLRYDRDHVHLVRTDVLSVRRVNLADVEGFQPLHLLTYCGTWLPSVLLSHGEVTCVSCLAAMHLFECGLTTESE